MLLFQSRFDTHKHRLCDNHPGEHCHIWPGQDYSNPRIKDFANVEHHEVPLINKANTPRMPWHDVTIGMLASSAILHCLTLLPSDHSIFRDVGPPARDVARHFVQRWNFIKASKGMHRSSIPFLTPRGEFVAAREESKFQGTCRVQVIRSSAEWSSGVEREHSIYNAYVECIMNAQHFIYIENQFFVTASQNDDKNVVKNKLGQAIVERIKRAHKEKKKFRIIVVMPLAPGFEGDFASSESATMRLVMHWQYVSMSRGGNSVIEKLRLENINPDDYISFFSLRSHDKFEVPVSEHSPTKMSPDQSRFAEHGGNQSYDPLLNSPANNLNGSGVPVDDKAQDATASPTAISPKGSRSSFDTKRKSVVSQNLTETTSLTSVADTIETTPPEADIQTGKRMTHKPTESVTTINPLDGRDNYVTEELYIHSKLLIVDDRIVICGSEMCCCINLSLHYRSQLGNRDSEIAMIIEDEDTVHTRMNGKQYVAAKFAHSLRCQLFKEHLGLLHHEDEELLPNNNEPVVKAEQLDSMNARDKGNNISVTAVLNVRTPTPSTYDLSYDDPMSKEDMLVSDPLNDSFYYNTWLRTAQVNTQVFREAYYRHLESLVKPLNPYIYIYIDINHWCISAYSTVTSFEEYRNFVPDPTKVLVGHVARPEMTASAIQEKLNLVKGHLVIFPTEFLKKENLVGGALKETVIPMEIFT
ncbi:hypothetical protein BC938DRAFT_474361 [Jimgerdemannia flammicorona]|uniref:phospholipase D n=1 Tax=Jimgerdemannia flammicorona TaxID=994334 RepID=A0A433Q2P3_9FUNG|nr:hypothetical protein BC938DRAFT_474361 [Jimgerdemannia flammicorona]